MVQLQKPYERFKAWQACHALALTVYRLTAAFPKDERYGLVSQMRRAAFSAAANIAEGSAKRGPAEFRRYLDIAIGSLSELAYATRLAGDLQYVSEGDHVRLGTAVEDASKLTWGLYRAMRAGASRRVLPARWRTMHPSVGVHSRRRGEYRDLGHL